MQSTFCFHSGLLVYNVVCVILFFSLPALLLPDFNIGISSVAFLHVFALNGASILFAVVAQNMQFSSSRI